MKTAVLIQTHKKIDHFYDLFKYNENVVFIIHFDKKSGIVYEKNSFDNLNNVIILDNPVNVYWGGFSQLEATLLLIKKAYSFENINFFHLISGDCLPLTSFVSMEKCWGDNGNELYLEIGDKKDIYWRLNIQAPHVDTNLIRTIPGRIINRILRVLGNRLKFTKLDVKDYAYGSQWFSFTREHTEIILDNYENGFFNSFRKIACADEHAFQILFKKFNYKSTDNRRFIKFVEGKSSPEMLSIEEICDAKDRGFWFARKVDSEKFKEFLKSDV
ncbi:beta-1,6-N-acetylglucosaminyltransferase [Rosenbergiella epipactidis]|uniref:beta-1,6-N-acetylglucosaminyltransferase n=1 Tax=Rosenbergiella epipactidis TaxID=1544694 RepID=UPI001F4EC43C|nr:beta-1,6-N-acetylglucosaminyltransferase [Rosenbergiella epipactidis]